MEVLVSIVIVNQELPVSKDISLYFLIEKLAELYCHIAVYYIVVLIHGYFCLYSWPLIK